MHLSHMSVYLVLMSTPLHMFLCFYCMGMALMKTRDDCQERATSHSVTDRARDDLLCGFGLVCKYNIFSLYCGCFIICYLQTVCES